MQLLIDRTTNRNLIWASGERPAAEITVADLPFIKRRIDKTADEQKQRTANSAEVFTPSWCCCMQNNLVDNAYFGREGVFCTETERGWITNPNPVPFPTADGKEWFEYVTAPRLEITCGEAPYLANPYDTVTGEKIPVQDRIGILDRKLRVVYENCPKNEHFWHWAMKAVESTYGFDWQGDNVYLARKNLLETCIDWYRYKNRRKPNGIWINHIANILTYNIWQMDGIKFVIPNSCTPECPACQRKPKKGAVHNGTFAKIRNWETGEFIEFRSLLKKENE